MTSPHRDKAMPEEIKHLPSQDVADSQRSGDRRLSTCCASLEPWECFQPVIGDQSARPWLGMEVTSRPDGGGWPLEKGIVHEGRGGLDKGWFRLVNDRHPDGIGTHTQEVYPPGFAGCTLPCCLHNVKGVARRRMDVQSEANEGRYPPLPLPSCSPSSFALFLI
jgi:hypothetical protein